MADDAKTLDLEERILPIEEAVTEGRLAVNLILKLVAELRTLDKLDDDEFLKVATALVVELGSDQERLRAWRFFEGAVPDFKRPEKDDQKRETEDS